MLDTDLFQTNYLGRDGFRWWIGQVADPDSSGWNKSLESEDPYHSGETDAPESIDIDDNGRQIFNRRCKVRILGYHTISDENGYVLRDIDLPWAHIMVGPGLATQDGNGSLHEYKGGENVLGFFMDGDEAQQPVIIGGFGRGKQVVDDNNIRPNGDGTIRPFTPNTETLSDQLKQTHKRLKTRRTDSEGNQLPRKATSPTTADAGSKDEIIGVESLEKTGGGEYASPQNCEVPIAEIETALRNIQYAISQVQEFAQAYIDEGRDITLSLSRLIGSYTKQIAGAIRKIFEKIKAFLLKQLGDLINEAIALLPENFKALVTVGFKTGIEAIICVFERILGSNIYSATLDKLERLFTGDLLDVLFCTVEEIITDLISTFLSPIIDGIQGALDLIEGILGSVEGVITDAISGALGVFDFILSFFECAPNPCRGERTWSFAGPSIPDNNIDNISRSLIVPGERSTINCDDNILWFLPPIIEIIGGGAIGLPVIRDGEIIGVYVDEPGRGYSQPTPPVVTVRTRNIVDPAGGAKVKAVVDDNGQISNFIVISGGSGYSSKPTFVKASVGGVVITSEDLTLPPDQLTIEKQASIQSLNITTTQDSTDVNVLPFLNGFEIISPGSGYVSTDKIKIDGKDPLEYGLGVSINFSPNGSIIKINIVTDQNNQPLKFDSPPKITIKSNTGSGVQILPIMDFVLTETIENLSNGDIIVKTPVGKTFKVNSSEILPVSNCPFK